MITQAFLRGAIVFLIAGLLTVVLSKRSAAVRHNIWASAIIIQLAILALIPTLPQITLPVLPTLQVTVDEPVQNLEVPKSQDQGITNPAASVTSVQSPPGLQAGAQRSPITLGQILLYTWLAGAALFFLRYVVGTILMFRLAQHGQRVDDGAWLTLAQRIANEMGIKRPITLLWGDKLAVPITWGILYPMILLPESANEWTLERRRLVLVHEMAHVRRFDALTQFVAQITLAVFWFSPFVWLAEWRLRVEREHACDDVVLHHGTEATLYADELLQMVRSLMSRRAARPAFAALAMARRSEFEGRMLAILDPERKRSIAGVGSAFLFLLVSLLIAAPVAALNPVAFNVETKTRGNEVAKQVPVAPAKPSAPSPSPSPSTSVAQCSHTVTKPQSGINVTISEGDVWHVFVRIEEPGRCIVGKAEGQFVLNDDETDVLELLGRDAIITLREVTAEKDIAVAMQPKVGGGIHTTIENVGSGPMNAEIMHRWIGTVLPQVMAEAAYHTDERIARLLSAHGLIGTLETIARIRSSSSLAYHYLSLIEARKWSDAELARIERAARRKLQGYPSDLDRVLRAMPRDRAVRETSDADTGGATLSWLEKGLASIVSDGELRTALTTHLGNADKPKLLMLARVAAQMSSGYELSSYLITASSYMLTQRDRELEKAWFGLANRLGSSYERRQALTTAISYAYGNPRIQNLIAESAAGMSSDHDRLAVLSALSSVR